MQFLSKPQRLFILICLISVAILTTSGCAHNTHPMPYLETFVAYRYGEQDFFTSCSDENSGWRVGVEGKVAKYMTVAAEWEHISHLTCGSPFNDKPEQDIDHVGIRFKIGGIQ